MKEKEDQLAHLAEIRSMMEQSSRFLSLSGLSGVSAGIIAIIGAAAAYMKLGLDSLVGHELSSTPGQRFSAGEVNFLILDAIIVLIAAILAGYFFTMRKAKRSGQKISGGPARRLAFSLIIPLVTGGIFCLILIYKYNLIGLVAPLTLIFYGLTLLNASKFTLDDVKYLGISEIILGLIATLYIGYGFWFWIIGFGILHIIYGTLMYFKYER